MIEKKGNFKQKPNQVNRADRTSYSNEAAREHKHKPWYASAHQNKNQKIDKACTNTITFH